MTWFGKGLSRCNRAKLRSLGWAPIQCDRVLATRGSHTQRRRRRRSLGGEGRRPREGAPALELADGYPDLPWANASPRPCWTRALCRRLWGHRAACLDRAGARIEERCAGLRAGTPLSVLRGAGLGGSARCGGCGLTSGASPWGGPVRSSLRQRLDEYRPRWAPCLSRVQLPPRGRPRLARIRGGVGQDPGARPGCRSGPLLRPGGSVSASC